MHYNEFTEKLRPSVDKAMQENYNYHVKNLLI